MAGLIVPYLQTPFTADSVGLTIIDDSGELPIAVPGPEDGALGHWQFGPTSASLNDIKTGTALTPANTAPSYPANYLVTADAGLNGLFSAFKDRLGKTICIVVKRGVATDITEFCGSLTNDSTVGSGLLMVADKFRCTTRISSGGTAISTDFTPPANCPVGTWVFMAYSHDDSGSGLRNYYVHGVNEEALVCHDSINPNLFLGLGNPQHDSAPQKLHGCSAAEFIIFGSALSMDQIKAIAARCVLRCAARGVPVYQG